MRYWSSSPLSFSVPWGLGSSDSDVKDWMIRTCSCRGTPSSCFVAVREISTRYRGPVAIGSEPQPGLDLLQGNPPIGLVIVQGLASGPGIHPILDRSQECQVLDRDDGSDGLAVAT